LLQFDKILIQPVSGQAAYIAGRSFQS